MVVTLVEMRLLDVHRLEVVDVFDDAVSRYAVLSHTWVAQEEVSFQDLQRLNDGVLSDVAADKIRSKQGYRKINRAASLAQAHTNGYQYIWIDTCCIDKSSSAELSEAINSMYRWYAESQVCYAYLSDVTVLDTFRLRCEGFLTSRWHERGWTLQELIAPKIVKFYDRDWTFFGDKNPTLIRELSSITGVNERILSGTLSPGDLSVANRMKWASKRSTTRPEDVAYCLMGLFGVNMPLLYGEGKRAFIRLQEEICRQTDDQSLFAWISVSIEGGFSTNLCGLLASSPAQFSDVPNLRPLPPLLTSVTMPWSISNQGLCTQLYLRPPVSEGLYPAMLDCSTRIENQECCPTIYLTRLWGDKFARVVPHHCDMLPLPTGQRHDGEGYQVLYVKQNPTYILPEITLARPKIEYDVTELGRTEYYVTEAYPPDRWDRSSLLLRSVHTQLNRVMGVFRFTSFDREHQVDVAVGFRRHGQNRWESWCSQRVCRGLPLDKVFAEFEDALKSHLSDESLSTALLSTRIGEDHRLGSAASVDEFQMHGRTYISLTLSSKPELGTSGELKTLGLPAGHIPSSDNLKTLRQVGLDVPTLTLACTIRDTAALSILLTDKTTSKARIRINLPHPQQDSLPDTVRAIAAALRPENIITRYLPSSFQTAELLYACMKGNIWKLRRLPMNVEAEAANFYYFRPIHFATLGGHADIVRYLLKHGAQADSKTTQGWTAVHLAVMTKRLDILDYLTDNLRRRETAVLTFRGDGTGDTITHLAAAYLSSSSLLAILDRLWEFDPTLPLKATNNHGEMPLHRAAAHNEAQTYLDFLRRTNVDPSIDATDDSLRTPVRHAACTGSFNSIAALSSKGALLNLADDHGRTPLHAACREGMAETVEGLLNLGANPNVATHPPGLTPAHYAAMFGHSGCLKSLQNHSADLERSTTSTASFRPIHLAAANGHLECVRILSDAGSLDGPSSHYILVNKNGAFGQLISRATANACEIAAIEGHHDIEQYLSKGVRLRTNSGQVP